MLIYLREIKREKKRKRIKIGQFSLYTYSKSIETKENKINSHIVRPKVGSRCPKFPFSIKIELHLLVYMKSMN